MKKAADWREYVTARFSDADRFLVQHFDDSTLVTDRAGRSQTEIDVRYFPDKGASQLCGVFYFNPRTPLWNLDQSRESAWCDIEEEDRVFTDKNIKHLEGQLEVPLRSGWTEELYFYKGEHVKSRLSWVYAGQPRHVTTYAGTPGCLMALFLPLRYSRLITGSHMRTETIVVAPMEAP